VFEIATPTGELRCQTGEYTELAWFATNELPAALSPITVIMTKLLRE
jgi:hypothetical protein